MSLTRTGQPMAGLPEDFALTTADIPAPVLQSLCEALPALEEMSSRETRIAVELLIDTGRRPNEICDLPLDCLQQDPDGKPVLIYDNSNECGHDSRTLQQVS